MSELSEKLSHKIIVSNCWSEIRKMKPSQDHAKLHLLLTYLLREVTKHAAPITVIGGLMEHRL